MATSQLEQVPHTGAVNSYVYTPGNADDFDRLYRDSYARVVKTLVAMLRDQAAAEDCAQDAFVLAFRSWGRWRGDGPAEAWLFSIARRAAISHIRRAKLRALPELLRRVGRPAPQADTADTVTESDAFMAALRQLPPDQAMTIVLRHQHGYSSREIATALDIPDSTVASRLAMARSRLIMALGDDRELPSQLRSPRKVR